jgi:hypothetical protein
MTKDQARALLALIADLYLVCQTPDPEPAPEPVRNGQEPAAVKT